MQNYVQPGDRLAIYNSSSTATLLAGVPVVVSGHIRIPIANISPLSWGEASAEEVFNLPAKAPTPGTTATRCTGTRTTAG